MLIHVTRQDITEGEPGRCETCPVALAISRQYKPCRIYISRVWFNYNTFNPTQVPLPSEIWGIIAEYDTRRHMEPFTFTLETPET